MAGIVFLGAPGALVVPHLASLPALRIGLVTGSFALAALLAFGVRNKATAMAAALTTAGLLTGWAWADTGGEPLPLTYLDPPADFPPPPRGEEIAARNAETLREASELTARSLRTTWRSSTTTPRSRTGCEATTATAAPSRRH